MAASTRPGPRSARSPLTASWGADAWLWPLVALVARVLGMRTSYVQLYMNSDGVDPFLLLALPLIAVAAGIVQIVWAEYNRARFRDRDRRNRRDDIEDASVEAALGAPPAVAGELRSARVVTVSLDEAARPVAVIHPGAA